MLKLIRRILALFFWLGITFLFLDVSGIFRPLFSWMMDLQFLPSLMRLDYTVLPLLLFGTLVLGRIYCSIICPAGVLQDFFSWIRGWKIFRRNSKARYANRFHYSEPKQWLRITVLVLFIVTIMAGVNALMVLIAPYSAYGRMVITLLRPPYIMLNNILATWSEANDNYLFFTVEQQQLPVILIWISAVSALILLVLSIHGGRTYCNTICPVGTILGFLSKYSWLRINVNEEKCIKCGLCEKNCKAACIKVSKDEPVHIDYSRCVVCGNCQQLCPKSAIRYSHHAKTKAEQQASDNDTSTLSRRSFLSISASLFTAAALKAEEKTTDGGLAIIEDKEIPARSTPLTPPGSLSARNLQQHCTACQLCIAQCPNGILSPSQSFDSFMQPEMQYTKGYCRPECKVCAEVCPTDAIRPITIEEKTAIQIGRAVWISKNCIPLTDGVTCGNCAVHCPTGAIQMVPKDKGYTFDTESGRWLDESGNPADLRTTLMIPVVNEEKCIGCGSCEYHCPSRPFSAIYVEGNEVHREV